MTLMSVSVAFSQTPAYVARPQHHMVCLFTLQLLPIPSNSTWWQVHGCEQLAEGCYSSAQQQELELMTIESLVWCPNHKSIESSFTF